MPNPLLPSPEREVLASLPRPLRVALSLDATSADYATLDAAVEIASALRAELLGVLFHDAALLQSVQLPFSREIGQASALEREFAPEQLLRSLRATARALEQRLAAAANLADVRWSLRVAEGRVAPTGLLEVEHCDLLVVGRPRAALGVAVAPRVACAGRRQIVLHQSLLATGRVFDLLGALSGGDALDLFLLSDVGAGTQSVEQLVALRALGAAIYHLAMTPDPHRVVAQLAALRLKPDWCLLSDTLGPLWAEAFGRALGCRLLIVRGTGASAGAEVV